jgi:tetratricopeptide (TPR) repeat protein
LYVEYALTFGEEYPDLALLACQAVIDASIRQKNPSQPIFYGLWALIAEKAGDMETAISMLEKAIALWENEPRWHHWAADIHLALFVPNHEVALDHLSQATNLEPKFGDHHLKLGQVYLQANNPQAAIPPLEESTRLLSNEAKPWLILAEANKIIGDTAQLFKNAERAAELDPKNIDPFLLLANTALEIGNPDKAFIYCENALNIDSSNPRALLLKSRAQEMVGKLPEALQSFDKAIEIAPQSISLMLEHAQLIRRASGIHAAVSALEALAKQHPNNPHVLAALAGAQVDNNQIEDAILTAQKALKVNNGNLEGLLEVHLLTTLGRLMRRSGQLDQAVNYLGKALQSNQESFDCYIELGRVYQDRRQYSTALDAFQQAIAIEPGNAKAYYLAGQTLKAAKDYTAAEEMLQTAAKLAPNDLAIRRQLGGLVALNLVHNRKENTGLYVE